jgi:hypothetical protein
MPPLMSVDDGNPQFLGEGFIHLHQFGRGIGMIQGADSQWLLNEPLAVTWTRKLLLWVLCRDTMLRTQRWRNLNDM